MTITIQQSTSLTVSNDNNNTTINVINDKNDFNKPKLSTAINGNNGINGNNTYNLLTALS